MINNNQEILENKNLKAFNYNNNNTSYNDGAQLINNSIKQQQHNQNQNQNNNQIQINQLQQIQSNQFKEKYNLRKENNSKFSTVLPNELMPFFTISEYNQLITTINKYKSPSEKFYLLMMIFEMILFLVATGLGFYFLSSANNNKTSIVIGLFLLILSVITLIGCSITFFRKSKMTINEIGDFYNKLNRKYESKNIRIVGVFKRKIYPKLGDNYYNIENNEIIFEYPKLYNSQGVQLHNMNTNTQYFTINSNDNNDKINQKIPLLTPKSLLSPSSSSINNDKL